MTLDELRLRCAAEAGFKDCSECPLYKMSDSCWEYLSVQVFPEECNWCKKEYYLIGDGVDDIYEVDIQYCPKCGRARKVKGGAYD